MVASVDELRVELRTDRLVNLAQVTVYPVETVGAAAVIWTAQTVLTLAPGEARVIYALFRDETGERCGAVDVVTPVATTDYTVNENRDGTGYDYTSSPAFALAIEIEATRAKLTLTNSAIGPLYVTFCQLRGKPIRTYDPVVVEVADATSQAAYQVRALALDLPMQPDPVFGQAYAEYLIGRFKAPVLVAERLVVKNRAVVSAVNVFSLELMDKIVISDAHTGLDQAAHWVRAVEYEIGGGGTCTATLHLERADERQYWLLGKAGYSELGSTTRLGF